MAKRPRADAVNLESDGPDESGEVRLLKYQREQIAEESRARLTELERLRGYVQQLQRRVGEHAVASGGGLELDEQQRLAAAGVAARERVQQLENELGDARQALAQLRRATVRKSFGIFVTESGEGDERPTEVAQPGKDVAPASTATKTTEAPAETAAAAPTAADADRDDAAAKAAEERAREIEELKLQCERLAAELEDEKQARAALAADIERYTDEKAELAGELELARSMARAPSEEAMRTSAAFKAMEAHLLLLLRAEQKWMQDREQLVRERDELLVGSHQQRSSEEQRLTTELESLKRRLSEKAAEIEHLKETTAKWQMMYEEKKKIAFDPAVMEETLARLKASQSRNQQLESALHERRAAQSVSWPERESGEMHVDAGADHDRPGSPAADRDDPDAVTDTETNHRIASRDGRPQSNGPEAAEYLAEIEALSASMSAAEANVVKLSERLAEKEAALGKVLAERLKHMQQQLTLKEQLRVETSRAERERELAQQLSASLAAARNQSAELQQQLNRMSEEMRVVRRQAELARRGAEKSAAEASREKALAEAARTETATLQKAAAGQRSDIERLKERVRAAEEQRAVADRRAARAERDLEMMRHRRGATGGGHDNWQEQMLEEMRRKLFCTVCKSQEKQVALSRCLHMFCRDCVQQNIANRNRKCPLCGERFGADDVRPIFFV